MTAYTIRRPIVDRATLHGEGGVSRYTPDEQREIVDVTVACWREQAAILGDESLTVPEKWQSCVKVAGAAMAHLAPIHAALRAREAERPPAVEYPTAREALQALMAGRARAVTWRAP